MRNAPECNLHHCLPSSRGWALEGKNVVVMIKKIHDRLHLLFENKTPKEQLEMILDINSSVIEKKVRHSIRNILEDEQMIYKEWVWIYK